MLIFKGNGVGMIGMREFRQEPYRLLFPLGLAIGAIGMGIWLPFFLWPSSQPYPGPAHAGIQMQGFLLCFILGFLGTMMPKVLGVKPLGPWQFALIPLGLVALAVFSLAGMPRTSQAMHLLVVFNFILFLGRRWKYRKAPPPPPFLFIGLGITTDVLGTCLRLHALSHPFGQSAVTVLRSAALLQYQAFPLLLILGVGSFLLPKLFARMEVNPNTLQAHGKKNSPMAAVMGSVFIATFILEAWGPLSISSALAIRIAHAARFLVWAWFLLATIRLHKVPFPQPAYLEGARMSLYCIGLGMLLPVFWPQWLLAWEHIVFIGGFLWITLSIASRVVTAHSGRLGLLVKNRNLTLAIGVLIAATLALRLSADLFSTGRWMRLAISGTLGVTALGIWAWAYLPFTFRLPGETADKP